jgi:chemotaxis protein methyltransferase CheR
VHNVAADPPLPAVDLLLCRNVTIYFERCLQEKVHLDFSHALNDQGYLFLGKAESLVGGARVGFATINERWRIYQKRK